MTEGTRKETLSFTVEPPDNRQYPTTPSPMYAQPVFNIVYILYRVLAYKECFERKPQGNI